MKKLLTSLATIALVSGSIASTTAWTQTLKTKHNLGAKNETAQNIANKLQDKTIKLNASFWVGKDIANYLPNLRAVLVQQGLLTKDEANYVSCGHLTFAKATVYPHCIFTVSKDGQTATAQNIAIDVSSSAQDIANKINKATLNLNLDYWNENYLKDKINDFRTMFVEEKILTQDEANAISLVNNDKITAVGHFAINLKVVSGGSSANATIHINVNDESDQDIALKLLGPTIKLDPNFWLGKNLHDYTKQFQNAIVEDGLLHLDEVQYVSAAPYGN